MLISLMMKAGWQWIFSLNLETFRNPRINLSAKSRLCDMYVVVVSCFHSILHLKTEIQGTYALNLRLLLCFRYRENVALKIYERNVSSVSIRRIYTVNG